MDLLKCLKHFKTIVDSGSFAKAAIALDINSPALSKQMAWLESYYGYSLLVRTTRQQSLTQEGEMVYALAERWSQDLSELDVALKAKQAEPQGVLKIGAPTVFTATFLLPKIVKFLNQYPKVRIAMTATNSPYALLDDQVDIVLAMLDVNHEAVVKNQLCDVNRGVFAAPKYLEKYGIPETIEDLSAHHVLSNSSAILNKLEWRFGKKRVRAQVEPYFIASAHSELIEAAIRGGGLLWSAKMLVAEKLKSKELVEVKLDQEASSGELFVYHLPVYKRALSRVFSDFIRAEFASS